LLFSGHGGHGVVVVVVVVVVVSAAAVVDFTVSFFRSSIDTHTSLLMVKTPS